MSSSQRKPWTRSEKAGRRTDFRERRKVLILCEDEKSACLYFKGFPLDPSKVEVQAVGIGFNTDSLVKNAIRRKQQAHISKKPFNEIWCVFDRDNFPAKNFNHAFELAEKHGIQVAWTNEAFEFWYLLHFNYHDTGMSRDEYEPRLDELLEESYEKNDPGIYVKLLALQKVAMRNAQRLEKNWVERGGCNPEKANPSTNVHKLVAFLNDFLDPKATESNSDG